MPPLAPLDYGIILGFLGISLVLGLAMSRRASKSLEHYFLGARSVPWYLLGCVGMANWFDLTGTILITSFLYMLGPRGLFIEFRGGAVLILAFMLVYTGKWHRRSGVMTGAEWYIYRFGESKVSEGVRLLSAIMAILSAVMGLGLLIRGVSLFLGTFFPFPAQYTTLGLMVLTTLYTVSSGFYGIVLTDLVQGVIVIASCGIIAVLAWLRVPDSVSLAATAERVTGNPAWTSSLPVWHTPMPPGYEAYSPLIMMAGFYFLRHFIGGLGTGVESRYFGARSDRDCGLQSLQQGVMIMFRWPLMIGFAVLGIYFVSSELPDVRVVREAAGVIHAHYPRTTPAYWHDLTGDIVNKSEAHPADLVQKLRMQLGPDWQRKLPLVGFNGSVNPEQILPTVLRNVVPTGLKGLLVVVLLAAMMSCKNGMVNGASAYFVKDLYQNLLRPRASNRELLAASYLSTLGIVLVAYLIGIATTSINDLWAWSMMSLMAGQLAPQVLRLYWWRCNAWGHIGGTVLGTAGALAQRLLCPQMPEPVQFMLTGGLSFAGTIAASLLTAPTPRPVLRHFYRTTRPFGWWAPLQEEIQGESRRAMDLENRNDMLAVPFALLWQVTLFLLPMQLVTKTYDAFWGTLPLFLLGLAGLYWFWWRPLMREPGR